MAYVFETKKSSSMAFTGQGRSLTLAGINGTETDANVIVNGIFGLLYLANAQDNYIAEELVRTVKQNVDNND